ncbi:hypothetical protein QJS04_geneDACA008707 [Acorus gramineus]|uniref:Vacuolar protein sorting-associated protein n=1 Tax=Acorus gramineus TaxID=55184 RepID=A0AAV9AAJ6_ACOGR|nr:hypothetical protein QJS04_geneDACA008707 [Acorus gramineus]
MLEDQVAVLLQKYLGNYVRGLNKEALKISAWNGDVELTNMQLKPEALNALKLPVKVKAGFLGSVRLKVPWSRLGQEPVLVYLDRIFVLAEPETQVEGQSEDAVQEAKKKRVKEMEVKLLESQQQFKSDVVCPLGVTLAKLSAVTVDDNGKETFVTGGALERIHKNVELERLAIYFDSDSSPWSVDKPWEKLLPSEWNKVFEVVTDDNKLAEEIWEAHDYVLQPVSGNAKYTKLRFDESRSLDQALQRAVVNLNDVTLCLTKDGYRDMLKLADNFAAFNQRLKYAHYRPLVSVKSDPKSWWKYAYRAVADEMKKASGKLSWEQVLTYAQLRKKYISLYASLLKSDSSQLVVEDNEEIEKLDNGLDIDIIIQWRNGSRTDGNEARGFTDQDWERLNKVIGYKEGVDSQLSSHDKENTLQFDLEVHMQHNASKLSATMSDSLFGRFTYKPFDAQLDWSLVVKASPCYVTDSIDGVITFFKSNAAVSQKIALGTAAAVQMTLEEVKRTAQQQVTKALKDHARFSLDLDIAAPKITIPTDFCPDKSHSTKLLLDFGNLILSTQDYWESDLSDERDMYMQFNMILSDVSAFLIDGDYQWGPTPGLIDAKPCNGVFMPVIDKCGVVVKLEQIQTETPFLPSTRLAVRLPSLGFHFSPACYHRLMQVAKIFQNEDADTSDVLSPWTQADFEGWLSLLSWKGVGNREAVWQQRYLSLVGPFLYVLENPLSKTYKQYFRLKSSAVIMWNSAAVTSLSEISSPGESTKAKSDDGNNMINLMETEKLFISGALDELRILFSCNYQRNQSFEKILLAQESHLFEFRAIGGQVELSIRGKDMYIGTLLKSLEIEDLYNHDKTSVPRYLARSFKNTNDTNLNKLRSSVDMGKQKFIDNEKNDYDGEDNFFEASDSLPDMNEDPGQLQGNTPPYISAQNFLPFVKISIKPPSFSRITGLLPDADYQMKDMKSEKMDTLDSFVKAQIIIFDQDSSLYKSIDKQVTVTLAMLSFFCHRPTILAIMEFVNAINLDKDSYNKFDETSSSKMIRKSESPKSEDNPIDDLNLAVQEPAVKGLLGKGKSRLIFNLTLNMARAQIFLMSEDGTCLATLSQNNLLTDIKVFPSSFGIKAALGNLKISDDSLPSSHQYFWVCDMRNPGGSSFVELDFSSFSVDDDDYIDFDYSLVGQLSEVRIIYLNRFVQEIASYFLGLASSNSKNIVKLKDQVTNSEKWFTTTEIEGSPALKLDLTLSKPIIVMPRKTDALDYLELDVLNITVQNKFEWVGNKNGMDAVHLDIMTIQVKDINLTVGMGHVSGDSMIQDVKGLSITINRSLRDLLHRVPSIEAHIMIEELKAAMSNKEYRIITECALSNISEPPHPVPPLDLDIGASSGDLVAPLVPLPSNLVDYESAERESWITLKVSVAISLMGLSLHSGTTRDASLCTVQATGAWILYKSNSSGDGFLSATLKGFTVIDDREETKDEYRLAIGKPVNADYISLHHTAASDNLTDSGERKVAVAGNGFAPALTMLIVDAKFSRLSTSISLYVQKPQLLVALDFILAAVEFFVPTNGEYLDSCIFLGTHSSYSILVDDDVFLEKGNKASVMESLDHRVTDSTAEVENPPEFVVELQAIGPELTFYNTSRDVGESSALSTKLLHAQLDLFLRRSMIGYLGSRGRGGLAFEIRFGFIFGYIVGQWVDDKHYQSEIWLVMKGDTFELNANALGLKVESNAIRVLEPFDTCVKFTNASGKTKIHVAISDIFMNFSFSILKLLLAVEEDILAFLRMTSKKVTLVCSQFDKVGTIMAPRGYVAVGCVVSEGTAQPPLSSALCILDSLVSPCALKDCIVIRSAAVYSDLAFWRVENALGSFLPADPSEKSSSVTSSHVFESVASFRLIWWNQGAASGKKLSIWRPVVPPGMVYLGDIALQGYDPPRTSVVLHDMGDESLMKAPLGFQLVGHIRKHKGTESVSFWFPQAPPGFVALGCVAFKGKEVGTFIVRNGFRRPPKRFAIKLADPNPSSGTYSTVINAQIQTFSAVLFDDYGGLMVPLLNLSFSGIGFSLHERSDYLDSTMSFSLAARSYNDKYDSWEPLVEPMDGFIRYQYDLNAPGATSQLRITSTRDMNMNVSVSNANMVFQAYSSWCNLSHVPDSYIKRETVPFAYDGRSIIDPVKVPVSKTMLDSHLNGTLKRTRSIVTIIIEDAEDCYNVKIIVADIGKGEPVGIYYAPLNEIASSSNSYDPDKELHWRKLSSPKYTISPAKEGPWTTVRLNYAAPAACWRLGNDVVASEVNVKDGNRYVEIRSLVRVTNNTDFVIDLRLDSKARTIDEQEVEEIGNHIESDEFFEMEKYNPSIGWINISTDTTSFISSNESIAMDEPQGISRVELPSGWEWIDDWHVDTMTVNTGDGWVYAPDPEHLRWPDSHNHINSVNYARGRRWIRHRKQFSTYVNQEISVGLLKPGETLPLPLSSLTHTSLSYILHIKPVKIDSPNEYSWSTVLDNYEHTENLGASGESSEICVSNLTETEKLLYCSRISGNSMNKSRGLWFCLSVKATEIGKDIQSDPIYDWNLFINSPLCLTNFLPFTAQYSVLHEESSGQLVALSEGQHGEQQFGPVGDLSSLGDMDGSVDLYAYDGDGNCLRIFISSKPCPYQAVPTKVISVRPYMTFTNRMGRDIFIKFSDGEQPKILHAYDARVAFVHCRTGSTDKFQIRLEDTNWCFPIEITKEDTITLVLKLLNGGRRFLRAEIRGYEEGSRFLIVFRLASARGPISFLREVPLYSIENRTAHIVIEIRQSGLLDGAWIQLQPLSTVNFSWENPYGCKLLDIRTQNGIVVQNVSLEKSAECSTELQSQGIHLHIIEMGEMKVARFIVDQVLQSHSNGYHESTSYENVVSSQKLGEVQNDAVPLELIVELGHDGGNTSRFKLILGHLQLDNQLPLTLMPVLLAPEQTSDLHHPVFKTTITMSNANTDGTQVFPYVYIRLHLRKVMHRNRFMRKSAIIPAITNRIWRDLIHNPLHLIFSVDVLGMTSSTLASLSKGFAELSTDGQFLHLRSKQVWSRRITGVRDGILQGTEALAQGVAFGVSGVLTKPVESTRQHGILGLAHGLGRAFVGFVVQPVSGALDFVSLTVDGIGASFTRCLGILNNKTPFQRIRNPRAIHANGLLKEYCEREAMGQMILYLAEASRCFGCTDIFKEPSKYAWSDYYECHFNLPNLRILLITDKRVMLLQCLYPDKMDKKPCKITWDVPWEELMALELAKAGYLRPSCLILHLKNFKKMERFVQLIKCNVEDDVTEQEPQAVRICAAVQRMWRTHKSDMRTLTLKVPSSQRHVQFAWDEAGGSDSYNQIKPMIKPRGFDSVNSLSDERRFIKHSVNFQKIWSSELESRTRCTLCPKQLSGMLLLKVMPGLALAKVNFMYVSIGDIAHVGEHPPNVAAIYHDIDGKFALPVGYDLVWRNRAEDYISPVSIWLPRAPEGYISIGCVGVGGFEEPHPSASYCVRATLAEETVFEEQTVWTAPGSFPWACYVYQVQSEALHFVALRQPKEESEWKPMRVPDSEPPSSSNGRGGFMALSSPS